MTTPEVTAIQIEKRLCGALMRQWSPSGMSVETLAEDAALTIEQMRRALVAIREEAAAYDTGYKPDRLKHRIIEVAEAALHPIK